MSRTSTSFGRAATVWLALAVFAGTGAVWGAGMATRSRVEVAALVAGAPRVELAADEAVVVIELREEFGEMESPDQPWLRIYADGRVERHLPFYMSQAGDWTDRISLPRLNALAQELAELGVVEFDGSSARSSREAALRESGALVNVSDTSRVSIEVNFAGYQPPGSLSMQRDVRKTVSWDGLRNDARLFPEIAPIRDLGSALSRLTALADRTVAAGVSAGAGEESR